MLDSGFAPSTKLIPREILSLRPLPAQPEEIRAFAAIAVDCGDPSEGHLSLSLRPFLSGAMDLGILVQSS
jgi:hypothetical protein